MECVFEPLRCRVCGRLRTFTDVYGMFAGLRILTRVSGCSLRGRRHCPERVIARLMQSCAKLDATRETGEGKNVPSAPVHVVFAECRFQVKARLRVLASSCCRQYRLQGSMNRQSQHELTRSAKSKANMHGQEWHLPSPHPKQAL